MTAISVDQKFIDLARNALLRLDRAQLGDSKDTEIHAGRNVAYFLAELIDYDTPADIKPLDADERDES